MPEANSYHDLPVEHIFRELKAGEAGLSQADASERLKKQGKNSLPRGVRLTASKLFLRQFQNPLAYILIFAMVLSFAMNHHSDAVIIALVVFLTSIIGFVQEYKANNALEKLNSIVTYKCRVLRDGVLKVIDQADVVIGDVIDICPGDIIPADARLISENNLKVEEAILTGESEPSEKFIDVLPTSTPVADRDNMVYQGTYVNSGIGRAVIVATGATTEMGRIASLLQDTDESETPLQQQIGVFGKWLSIFLVLINFLIFISGMLLGRSFFEMFMISVVVVVSAVPEGIAPAMSVVLALGMQRLIKKNGLVRKVVSAETLGSVSIICSDKTGTLTEGEMSVERIITLAGSYKISKVNKIDASDALTAIKIGVISNNAVAESSGSNDVNVCAIGNTTDRAMLLAGLNYSIKRLELEKIEPRIAELPFSSEAKIMATLHRSGSSGKVIYAKGAAEKILALSKLVLTNGREIKICQDVLDNLHKTIEDFTGKGNRVVAVAYKKTKDSSLELENLKNLVFVGFFVIKDKVRGDAKQAVALCHQAGVKVVMITGDHAKTAMAIAKELGIKANISQVITGNEIDDLAENELVERVKNILIYARVEPRHKLRIISFLQQNGEIVAMTGDGVNDAPALKKADIGVVMGNGTDVAKEVADLVLLDGKFMTIVEAIKQGRNTFANIRKVVVYLFTDCFQEMVIIGTSVLAGWPLPLLPAQILWSKLIESPLPATSLAFEESKEHVLSEKPRGRAIQLLTRNLKINIAIYAIIMDLIALSIFYFYWQSTGDITKTRTVIFVALGMSSLFNVYNVRTLGESVFKANPFANKYLTIATIAGIALFFFAIYSEFMNKVLETVPLELSDWGIIMLYACASLFAFEFGKIVTRYKL